MNLKISHRLRIARKGDILEEHDPNKALVGCYLNSFLGRLILVLAYCHCVLGEKRKVERGVQSSAVKDKIRCPRVYATLNVST